MRRVFTLQAALLVALARAGTAQRQLEVGSSAAFRTIGTAVAAASPGDRIVVHAGVYHEPTIAVDKARLSLLADSGAVIDGGETHTLVFVTADDVTIRGFVLRNVGTSFVEDRAAIRVANTHGCAIDHNRVENGFFGIYLAKVTDCRIADNVIASGARRETESGNGIHLWTSRRITIERNRISGHRDGIYFEFVHDSDIRDNVSTGNLRYGLHFMYSDDCRYVANTFRKNGSGVAVMFTHRVEMLGNHFEDNWGPAAYGLLLKEIDESRLEGNVFAHNTTGLVADGADRLIADHNTFDGNGWGIRLEGSTSDARFTRNNFLVNTFDVSTNTMTPGATFAGNHWDTYRGFDLNHDGVGDVPHRPVRLFSVLVEHHPPALILLRSAFADLLDAAERALPSLTPNALIDAAPSMRIVQ